MNKKMISNDAHASRAMTLDRSAKTAVHTVLARRIGMLLLALVLCVGLMPSFALAADDGTSDGLTAALTVVDATDNGKVVFNEAVSGLDSDSTVADLLGVAGFAKVDSIEGTAADMTYYDDGGTPAFLSKGADGANAWVAMLDGTASDDADLTAEVEEDSHYQYLYGSDTTFSYSDDILDPLADDDEDDDADDAATDDSSDRNPYDATAASTLLDNLEKRFSTGGTDASITNDTVYAAIALNMLGKGSKIDGDAILANLNTYKNENEPTAGAIAKYIMALTAAGMDCKSVSNGAGGTQDLIAEMDSLVRKDSMDVYSAVWILWAYEYGSYEQGSCEMSLGDLANFIMDSRDEDGLVGDEAYGGDTQTTAQAIFALITYYLDVIAGSLPYINSDPDVYEAAQDYAGDLLDMVIKSEVAIETLENTDGGFGYSVDYPESNIDATANASAAFKVMGGDPTSTVSFWRGDGSTPIGYLTAQADADLSGYTENSPSDEAMTSATVFMALTIVESDIGYHDLTAQPVGDGTGSSTGTGSYTSPSYASYSPSTGSTTSSTTPASSSTTSPSSGGNSLAKTGDDTSTVALAGAIALGALACALFAVCRMYVNRDTNRH